MRKHAVRESRTRTINAVQQSRSRLIDAALQAGETCLAWNEEVFRFASDRLHQDAELGLALANCHTWSEAAELQRDWAANTTQDYLNEGARLFRIATNWRADAAGTPAEEA